MSDAEKTQWHPAFRQAIELEFEEYKDMLEFKHELPLNTEPLRIDTLIIKKPPEVVIKKNIGRIFLGHNVIEYKSPSDNITVSDYYKSFTYLYLYIYLNRVDIKDITITLAVSNHPRDLLLWLKSDSSLTVEEYTRGIYYIRGERVPIQLVDTKELTENENFWLSSLRRGLDGALLFRVLDESRLYGSAAAAYKRAIVTANYDTAKGVGKVELAELMMNDPELEDFWKSKGWGDIREVQREAAQVAQAALAEKEAALAEQAALIAELRAKLGESK